MSPGWNARVIDACINICPGMDRSEGSCNGIFISGFPIHFLARGGMVPPREYLWSVAKQVECQLARKMLVNLHEKK